MALKYSMFIEHKLFTWFLVEYLVYSLLIWKKKVNSGNIAKIHFIYYIKTTMYHHNSVFVVLPKEEVAVMQTL